MTQKKDLHKSIEKMNKWEDSMAIVHQTIYGHPLQVIMAALKGIFFNHYYHYIFSYYNDIKFENTNILYFKIIRTFI